jgi:ABC-2 type transport system ATP-binding protein
MSEVIVMEGVVKSFGSTRALDELTLTVQRGEVHGFLGPNGAGKTTAIRVLLGMLRADSGRAQLLGGDPWADAVELHRRIAYVPGDVSLWPDLTGGEAIDILSRLRGGVDETRRDRLIERFALDPRKKGRTYSKGNRQKVAIIAGLAADAELLIMDEPTAGLDPLMEATFKECVHEQRAEGRTVLLSSHTLAQVEALCDRVTIISAGRDIERGSLTELRHLTRTAITASTEHPVPGLHDAPGVHDLHTDDGRVRFSVDGDHLQEVVSLLADAGVRDLVSAPPGLEEIFLRYYRQEGAGQTAADRP